MLHYKGYLAYDFLQPSFQIFYKVSFNKKLNLAIGEAYVHNVVMRKKICYQKEQVVFSKNLFERYNAEIYPAVSIGYSHFNLELGYRILNRQYQDLAIPSTACLPTNITLPNSESP